MPSICKDIHSSPELIAYIFEKEIGEKFGLTRERVRQIKEKAIRRLRHSARSKLLKGYLG